MTRYFTKGELLPWKGRYLILEYFDKENNKLVFSLGSETTGELKRRLAEEQLAKRRMKAICQVA